MILLRLALRFFPYLQSFFYRPCNKKTSLIIVFFSHTTFAEPVLPETASTARFPPVWVPPYSPRPDIDIWSSTAKPMLTTLDPEDYEDESLPDSDDIPGTNSEKKKPNIHSGGPANLKKSRQKKTREIK